MQAMNNRRTRRLPRDFRRLPHPGMDPDAALVAEHRRLSAVVDVASLLGRETSASASLAPTVGQRATPVHDRAGAQDRTQLLPQEEQR